MPQAQRSFRLSKRGDSILVALSAKLGWSNKAVIERALELFEEKETQRDKAAIDAYMAQAKEGNK